MSESRDPLLLVAAAIGCLCAALACVPTDIYASWFAHPVRVARLDGAIPEATLRGALFFRIALAAGAVFIPALICILSRMCAVAARRDDPRHTPEALPSTPRARRDWLIVGALIAFGALVRVVLAQESLWYDEISALLSFALEGPGVAFGSYTMPTNHVPMTLAVWLSVTLLGSVSELVVRLPALLAGIASIPAAFALGSALRNAQFGNTLAFVAALAPLAVIESAEARGYPFVILAAIVAATALARASRTGARSEYALFALASAFGAWAHPVAVLLPFAAGVVGVIRDRRLAVAALLAGVMATVLLAPLLGDVLATRGDYARTDAAQPSIFSREGYETLTGVTLSWSRWWMTPAPVLTLLFIMGAWLLLGSRDNTAVRARQVLTPFALALVLALALPPLLGSWTYARFTLFALPIGLVAIGWTLDRLPQRPWSALVFALFLCDALVSISYYRTKQPIREAVAIVAELRTPNDAVVAIGLPDNAVGFYARQLEFEAPAAGFLGRDLGAALLREQPKFVVVLYPDRIADETLATLDDGFDRTHRLDGWADWGHGAVEIWRRSAR
jgi:hypothetical protein